MIQSSVKLKLRILILALALAAFINPAGAQGTAFTYQGRLNDGGGPANGLYDFGFKLFADPLGNTPQVGTSVFEVGVPVSNGLFTATIDFGAGIFAGSNYWLEVDVRTNDPANLLSYLKLTPNQAVTPTPYAIFANSANNLLGTVSLAQLPESVVVNHEFSTTLNSLTVDSNLAIGAGPYGATAILATDGDSLFISDTNDNLYLGDEAGVFDTGFGNVGLGYSALLNILEGTGNTAVGNLALADSESPTNNTAIGASALQLDQTGNNNTAVGARALFHNDSGAQNTALGAYAMQNSSGDGSGVAVGYQALQNDNVEFPTALTGSGTGENTAVGYEALDGDIIGAANTALGYGALFYNTNGNYNTALGDKALINLKSGTNNIAIGSDINGLGAGENLMLGSGNIYVGSQPATSTENTTIRIGEPGTQTYTTIAGIYGGTPPGSGATVRAVEIDNSGHLISATTNSFTPTIGDGTRNFTLSTQYGYYSEVGNYVNFEIYLVWTGKGSAVAGNNLAISLPVPVASQRATFPLGYVSGISFANQLALAANNGQSSLYLVNLANTGTTSLITVANCANSGQIEITGSYRWQ
jgi:hypothetical protein